MSAELTEKDAMRILELILAMKREEEAMLARIRYDAEQKLKESNNE